MLCCCVSGVEEDDDTELCYILLLSVFVEAACGGVLGDLLCGGSCVGLPWAALVMPFLLWRFIW
jgi:hypothetical protein